MTTIPVGTIQLTEVETKVVRTLLLGHMTQLGEGADVLTRGGDHITAAEQRVVADLLSTFLTKLFEMRFTDVPLPELWPAEADAGMTKEAAEEAIVSAYDMGEASAKAERMRENVKNSLKPRDALADDAIIFDEKVYRAADVISWEQDTAPPAPQHVKVDEPMDFSAEQLAPVTEADLRADMEAADRIKPLAVSAGLPGDELLEPSGKNYPKAKRRQ